MTVAPAGARPYPLFLAIAAALSLVLGQIPMSGHIDLNFLAVDSVISTAGMEIYSLSFGTYNRIGGTVSLTNSLLSSPKTG